MATPTISNTYVGDGTTVLYSFTFPYIEVPDVKVQLDEVETTEYIFANATTIQFNIAPVAGTAITIFRSTDNSELKSVFFPGSAIRARDLNDNFTQTLYVVQEASLNVGDANSNSEQALSTANTALARADQSLSESGGAAADASTAQAAAVSAQADAATAQADATQAATDSAAAIAAATAAQEAAEAVEDAVSSGPVMSVNGQSGVVTIGVEQLADFAYYPASEQVTLLGPCVSSASTFSGTEYTSDSVSNLYFEFPKTNTQVYDVLSQLSNGDPVTVCFYSSVGTVYTEVETTFSSLSNNGGAVPSWFLQFNANVPGAVLGDYPVVFKSPLITNGQAPITTGQALIYDQTTEKWRPEDVSLNIGSLPTLP